MRQANWDRKPVSGKGACLVPFLLILLFLTGETLQCAEPAAQLCVPAEEGWTQLSNSPKLAVYSRAKKGSLSKEYKAFGSIAAPCWVVENILEDAEAYPRFMPYVVESHVLAREEGEITTYQRVAAPFVSDRDYVLRVRVETRPSKGGLVYLRHWNAAPKQAYPERPGVIRVKLVEGSWTLEPAGESTTRATYSVFTDPGGAIPASILNYANQSVIPRIFAAIEKQASQQKYREKGAGK